MRGRKPEGLTILTPDIRELKRIAHREMSPGIKSGVPVSSGGIAAGLRGRRIRSGFATGSSQSK